MSDGVRYGFSVLKQIIFYIEWITRYFRFLSDKVLIRDEMEEIILNLEYEDNELLLLL